MSERQKSLLGSKELPSGNIKGRGRETQGPCFMASAKGLSEKEPG